MKSIISAFTSRLQLVAQFVSDINYMAGPHRPLLVISAILSITIALTEGLVILTIVPLIGGIFGFDGNLPPIFDWAKETFGLGADSDALSRSVILLLCTFFVRQFITALVYTINEVAQARIVTHVRELILKNVLAANFPYLDNLKSGWLRQVFVVEVGMVAPAIRLLVQSFSAFLLAGVVIGLLINLSPGLLIPSIALIVIAIPLKIGYARMINRMARRSKKSNVELNESLNEMILGIREIKLTGRQDSFVRQLVESSRNSLKDGLKSVMLVEWQPVFIYGGAVIGICSVLLAAGGRAGTILAPAFLIVRAIPSILQLARSLSMFANVQPAVALLSPFARIAPGYMERVGGVELMPEQAVNFVADRVSLSYPKVERPALQEVSFSARRGEIIAIVGESGAGKSSILSVLSGAYVPNGGDIKIGGVSLKDVDLKSLRRCIGLVRQDVHIFNTTIENNIRGGMEGLSLQAIEEAASAAEATEFIDALPQRYQTVVGERGQKLSGGQRQRLLLAQVLARQTPIIVLDEATSALDADTEFRILRNLQKLRHNRIMIVVTHRLTTLSGVDRIYMMKEGRVVETGSFEELMAGGGEFSRLYDMQIAQENGFSPSAAPAARVGVL